MATQELTFKINFDPAVATAEMRKFTTSVEASLRQVGVSERQQAQAALAVQRQTEAAKLRAFQQSITQISREEQRRVAESVRAANQRLREEQRAAREVARITAETARQAAAQDRIRERAAKALADVQVREARRAARELERSLATRPSGGPAGGNLLGSISSIASGIPGVGNLAAQFNSVSTAATAAGGSVAAFAAPVAIAVTAATGLAAAIAFVGKTFFDLTVATAEFQGKFRDLSQQVGVSAESLSTLDFFAETTGGNIETVSASLGLFQKNLEAAHDPTSKEAKLLKDLGVTSLDTETALRQTVKGLFNLGEGSKQTTTALDLFGRSGRFVNAIVKESGGDFDKAGQAAAKFGRLVTTEAAIAADRFNDSLVILRGQIGGLTRSLTQDSIPVFIAFFDQISKGLSGNAADWKSWSREIATFTAFTLANLKTVAEFAASGFTLPIVAFDAIVKKNFQELLQASEKIRREIGLQAVGEKLLRDALATQPTKFVAKPGKDKADDRANKEIQLQQQALEETTRVHRERLERERQLDLKSIDEWEEESITALLDHRIQQQEIFNQEAANVRKFIKDRADQLLAEREIALKSTKLNNETLQAIQKIQDDANRRRLHSELALNQQLTAIRDAEREGELKKIRQDLEAGFITRSAAIQREIALLQQAFADRQILRDLELNQITTSAERKIELDNEKIESERRLTDEVKRLTRERIRALIEEGGAQTPPPNEGQKPETPKDGNILTPEDLEKLGPLPPPPDFSPWRDAIRQVKDELRDFGQFASSAIRDGLLGVADALAQGVEAWALYGESIGKAMKKALAASLARVAGEATFQGALHAAWAIGSLAFGDFGGAAKHGIAAAKFFAVAAATGLAARAIAGTTFRQDSAGSGGAGGGGSQGPQQLNPLTFNRNQPQPTRTIVLQIQSNDSHIVKVVGADIRSAGQLRELILNDESI